MAATRGALLFQAAASTLGARVARLRPDLSDRSPTGDVQHTARLLGRLYDALGCIGLSPALVRAIGESAGVPVFESISSPGHPVLQLARQLGGDDPGADQQALVQAVLLVTLT